MQFNLLLMGSYKQSIAPRFGGKNIPLGSKITLNIVGNNYIVYMSTAYCMLKVIYKMQVHRASI